MATTTRAPEHGSGNGTGWSASPWAGSGGGASVDPGSHTPWVRQSQQAWPPGGANGRRRRDGAARHSIPLGRVAGLRLEMHWSFLVLVALVVLLQWGGGSGAVVAGLVWIAVLFACVVVHEVAHCIVARRRGGNVLGILLLPIGGMSRMERIPSAPGDEAAIAIAGPATSLAIGGLSLAVAAAIGSAIWPPALLVGSWWARLGWLNLLLGAFNLLPALPMDGGRVLRAALAHRRGKLAATRLASQVAKVLAVGLVVAGALWDFWLVLIGIFVYLGPSGEEAQAVTEERRRGGWGGGWGNGQPGWGPSGWGPPPNGSAGPPGWGPPGWGPPGWGPPGWGPPGWGPPAAGGWGPPASNWPPPADRWPPPPPLPGHGGASRTPTPAPDGGDAGPAQPAPATSPESRKDD